jgi:hypothetical protein
MKHRILLCLLGAAAFLSCNKKTEIKRFTDGNITVEVFTAIRPEVQISEKNVCIVKASKNGRAEMIVSFNSYAVNNVNVEIKGTQIIIKALDDLTWQELKKANEKAEEALGYKVVYE